MSDQFLEIELRLLILRYGKQRVIKTLAELSKQNPEELERLLLSLETKQKSKKPKKSEPTYMDLVASECRERPEIAEPFRIIAIGFENRSFLPHLRDVRQFLERMGSVKAKLKSRSTAGPAFLKTLSKLNVEDLLKITSEISSSEESDYSLLTRAIMGKPSPKRQDKDEPIKKHLKNEDR